MPNVLLTDAELDGIRIDVEEQFEDEVLITRITQQAEYRRNAPDIPEVRATIYAGRAAIQPHMSRRDRFDEFGQGLIFTRQYRLKIPWDAPLPQIRDRVVMTVSRDPELVGREMEVRDPVVGTNVGYRRVTVHDSVE